MTKPKRKPAAEAEDHLNSRLLDDLQKHLIDKLITACEDVLGLIEDNPFGQARLMLVASATLAAKATHLSLRAMQNDGIVVTTEKVKTVHGSVEEVVGRLSLEMLAQNMVKVKS